MTLKETYYSDIKTHFLDAVLKDVENSFLDDNYYPLLTKELLKKLYSIIDGTGAIDEESFVKSYSEDIGTHVYFHRWGDPLTIEEIMALDIPMDVEDPGCYFTTQHEILENVDINTEDLTNRHREVLRMSDLDDLYIYSNLRFRNIKLMAPFTTAEMISK